MSDHGQGDLGEPLLVRRYLHTPVRGGAATQTDVRWPAGAAHPAVVSREELPAVLPAAEPVLYGTPPAPPRRRRAVVLAAAGAVAAAGLATAGYTLFAPDDSTGRAPLIAGAQPPALPSPSEGAVAAPEKPAEAEPPTAGPATENGGGSGTENGGGSDTEGTPEQTRTATPRGESVQEKPAGPPAGTPGTPATTAPATEGAKNPLLLAPPAPAPAARTGRITADDGRCLDLFANNPADGNRIQVFTCNGTSAQTFTLATDGTLRVRDMCADVSRRATVRITGCGDRDVTRWRAGGNGTLTSASSGRCLTRPAAGRESVAMTRCSGSAAQKWALP